jgi:hypothetical protein
MVYAVVSLDLLITNSATRWYMQVVFYTLHIHVSVCVYKMTCSLVENRRLEQRSGCGCADERRFARRFSKRALGRRPALCSYIRSLIITVVYAYGYKYTEAR